MTTPTTWKTVAQATRQRAERERERLERLGWQALDPRPQWNVYHDAFVVMMFAPRIVL